MVTTVDNPVVIPAANAQRSPVLDRLLQRLPAREPEHHWEGELTGTRGSAKGSVLRIKALIGFRGDLVEGAGRCVNLPTEGIVGADGLILSGSLSASGLNAAPIDCVLAEVVTFDLAFDATPIGQAPVQCSGQLDPDHQRMAGDW